MDSCTSNMNFKRMTNFITFLMSCCAKDTHDLIIYNARLSPPPYRRKKFISAVPLK